MFVEWNLSIERESLREVGVNSGDGQRTGSGQTSHLLLGFLSIPGPCVTGGLLYTTPQQIPNMTFEKVKKIKYGYYNTCKKSAISNYYDSIVTYLDYSSTLLEIDERII